jgi:hypothetical protein
MVHKVDYRGIKIGLRTVVKMDLGDIVLVGSLFP